MSRIRRRKNINKAKIRNLIIVLIIAIFMFSIYKFNFLTKSEVTVTTPINFVELGTGNAMNVDIELFQDENENYYIILPETVNGFFVQKYYVNKNIISEISDENKNTTVQSQNTTVEEAPIEIELEKPTNSVNNENQVITGGTSNENTANQNTINGNNTTNTVINETNVEKGEKTNLPVTAQADSLFDLAKAATSGENILESAEDKEVPNENLGNGEDTSNFPEANTSGQGAQDNNTNQGIQNDNQSQGVPGDSTNENNGVVEDTSKNEETNGAQENGQANQNNNNTVPGNDSAPTTPNQPENNSETPQTSTENENSQNSNENKTNTNTTLENNDADLNTLSVGERLYLTKEDVESGNYSIEVEYQTVEINNLKLYKQELKADLGEALVKLTGFIPAGYYLNVTPEDINAITELKADTEELKDSEVLLAYDIKILKGDKEYQPVDYFQTVNVEITSAVQLAGKIDDKPVEVVHIAEDTEKNEIRFEKISLAEKQTDKIEFITNEFSTYAVLAYSAIQDEYVNVYDYDSDYNYYMGKNYTDNMAGTNQNKYTDDNLAKVTINYYSYDYSKNINESRTFNITPTWSAGRATTSGRYRIYPITINASSNNPIIDDNKNWQMSFVIPQAAANSFDLARTQQENNGISISYDTNTRQMTLSGNNWDSWTKDSYQSYTYTLDLAFTGNVTISNVEGRNLTATEKNLIGYVSADQNERQSLFIYTKCIPITNGQISIDLIDNPYIDRPAGFGFDGWITNEVKADGSNKYTISTDSNTYAQTLTATLNDIKNANGEYEINLYANWKEANIVFLNTNSGNDNNSGTSVNEAVRSWNTATNILSRNEKRASNASSRELNILVFVNGSITADTGGREANIANIGIPYTLTALYDGNLYRDNTYISTYSNLTLGNDLQLEYLKITGTYYSEDEGTGNITPYLRANKYNLRIGRGIVASSNTYTNFAQIQGGGSSNKSLYKIVIESGRYNNLQVGVPTGYDSYTSCGINIYGSDFDRVKGDNSTLNIYFRTASRTSTQSISGYNGTINYSGSNLTSENGINYLMLVKSGTFGMDLFRETNSENRTYTGIYLGGHGSSGVDYGDRFLIVEGGNIANIIGGLQMKTSSSAKTYIYVKDGSVQNIVGGAGVSMTNGDRIIQVTGGNIAYSISGGSNGFLATTNQATGSGTINNGRLDGSTLVYVAGDTVVGTAGIQNTLYDVEAGCVLGAGNGRSGRTYSGAVNSSKVIIGGNAQVLNDVYAGGNYGLIYGTSNSGGGVNAEYVIATGQNSGNAITNSSGTRISNSTFNGLENLSDNSKWILEQSGDEYYIRNKATGNYLSYESSGGWNQTYSLTMSTQRENSFQIQNNGSTVRIYFETGYIFTRTYYLIYNNGWSISTSTNRANLYLNAIKKEEPDPEPEPDDEPTLSNIEIIGGTIGEDVYAGGNRNGVNGSISIDMKGGEVKGTIYGGPNTSGEIQEFSRIKITGGIIGTNTGDDGDAIFSGGKGQDTTVSEYTTLSIADKDSNINIKGNIYGGSALGVVNNDSTVTIEDRYSDDKSITIAGNIYGGGKGDNRTAAQNGGNVTVTVDGGSYSSAKAFGGCNINGTIDGNILVKIGENYSTTINEVYGGGNQSQITTDSNNVYVYLYKNAVVGNAFNGGNNAGIDGNNTNLPRAIYAKGAKVDNLYGGSNSSGELSETFVYCSDGATIGNVYGGGYGQNTNVTGDTNVNITSIDEQTGTAVNPLTTITGNAFGGGDSGPVNGYTNVNIISSAVNGTVYGGGNNAEVGRDTNVTIDKSNIATIFGGGNLGIVSGNTNVDIMNSSNIGTLYGGGCSAAVNGETDVYVEGSTANDVYGGGQGVDAIVQGDTNVNLVPNGDIKTTVNQNVYGGGDQGKVNGKALINVTSAIVNGTIYGGGNRADVENNTSISITDSSTVNTVYGGGNEGKIGTTTSVTVLNSSITDTVYGGGNKGAVTGNTVVIIDTSNVAGNVFGGGKAANVNGTQVTIQGNSTTNNVYGGGDQGEVIEETNVLIDDSIINQNVYGGGNGAATIETAGTIPGKIGTNTNTIIRNNVEIKGNAFGGGQGITAIVEGNTNFDITNSVVGNDIYGGGDNGSVTGNTNVYVDSSTITGNAYAAGNGANAVVRGNSYILAEGTTNIGKSIFGGGNAAETGPTGADTSLGIVDIAGAIIGENAYGGANSSVINGNTIVNIGLEAINQYYGTDKGYKQGKIDIGNTVFGGGESMDPSKDFDYDSISVTGTILINIDGKNYAEDDINIGGSIFGSGNASSAKTNGDINIRNYGTLDNPKKGVSIQRASKVLLDNANITLSGTTDSTSVHASTYFTLNRISTLTLKNNSAMFLRNGANLLENFYSMVGEDGKEEYAQVTVNNRIYTTDGKTYDAKGDKVFDRDGNIEYYMQAGAVYNSSNEKVGDVEKIENLGIDKNVDNRIYMYSGINLNISPSENLESYGEVKGMTFFGIYKNAAGGDGGDSDIYTGMYDKDYTLGNQINWNERDFTRCYVVGMHQKNPEQDIQVDGFYTNFEKLDVELSAGDVLTEENYSGVSYCNYITPTPENDIYYMWYAGPDVEVYYYTLGLMASKFSTLGTKELSLLGLSFPNATLTIHSVDSSLAEGVGLYDKNTIPNINPDQDAANNNFGLGMKTGNSGWSMNGGSDFYSDPDGNVASYSGDEVYTIENSSTTPSLSFYLYHSNNITEEKELGYYTITMDLAYWKDSLNQGRATVIIDISLGTSVYDDFGYNGAITPGTQYDLFTSTETNVTTDSSFSAYFELAEPNFKQNEQVKNFYEDSYRVINTEYVFPANTTITMIDKYDNAKPEYYYYTVTEDDVRNGKVEYRFSEFLAMGSTNQYYDEKVMREKYYKPDLDYEYECFIFIVNFEGADFGTITDPNKMVTSNQHFRIFLRADVEADRSEVLFGLLDDQIDSTTFGIWDTESKIDIDASLNKTKIYLGNDATLNIKTNFDVTVINSVRIYDTNYFDKKLGIKITFFDKDTNQVITGSSLLGTYFELNGEKYYPRTDGTTRIKIAEKVSNATSSISINTENSTLASGDYYILVESFGSADGIYYGIEASASDTVDLQIINDIYGLKSTLPEEQVIIDKATGYTLEKDTGYISEGNNNLNIDLEYVSGLTDPHITVSLYRRNYDDVYDMSYTQVDLKEYVNEELTLLDSENIPLEYVILNSDQINAEVSNPDTPVNFDINYTLKQNLKTGTYKLVFTLYDENIVTKTRPVEDEDGNIIQEEYQAIEYEHIGETYSYIIIK